MRVRPVKTEHRASDDMHCQCVHHMRVVLAFKMYTVLNCVRIHFRWQLAIQFATLNQTPKKIYLFVAMAHFVWEYFFI